jgi:hypothetical protein
MSLAYMVRVVNEVLKTFPIFGRNLVADANASPVTFAGC